MVKNRILVTKLRSLCLVLFLLLAVIPSLIPVEAYASTYSSENQIEPRIDETEWYYRVVDGILQMRLWSYTEGKWLTDWIDIGTA